MAMTKAIIRYFTGKRHDSTPQNDDDSKINGFNITVFNNSLTGKNSNINTYLSTFVRRPTLSPTSLAFSN